MSARVARSRELVARGHALATVARVLHVTRQAIYRTPKLRSAPQRRPPVDDAKQSPSNIRRRVLREMEPFEWNALPG